MQEMSRTAERFGGLYAELFTYLEKLQLMVTDFTAFALAPAGAGNISFYHVVYRLKKGCVMSAYTSFAFAVDRARSEGLLKDTDGTVLKEIENAGLMIQRWRTSPFYFDLSAVSPPPSS